MSGSSASKPLGGDNSVFNKPGQIFGGNNSIFRKPFGSSPAPEAPPPPPDPAAATNDALNKQLNQELQIRRSNALTTGGTGLVDSAQTQTASQLLLGT